MIVYTPGAFVGQAMWANPRHIPVQRIARIVRRYNRLELPAMLATVVGGGMVIVALLLAGASDNPGTAHAIALGIFGAVCVIGLGLRRLLRRWREQTTLLLGDVFEEGEGILLKSHAFIALESVLQGSHAISLHKLAHLDNEGYLYRQVMSDYTRRTQPLWKGLPAIRTFTTVQVRLAELTKEARQTALQIVQLANDAGVREVTHVEVMLMNHLRQRAISG